MRYSPEFLFAAGPSAVHTVADDNRFVRLAWSALAPLPPRGCALHQARRRPRPPARRRRRLRRSPSRGTSDASRTTGTPGSCPPSRQPRPARWLPRWASRVPSRRNRRLVASSSPREAPRMFLGAWVWITHIVSVSPGSHRALDATSSLHKWLRVPKQPNFPRRVVRSPSSRRPLQNWKGPSLSLTKEPSPPLAPCVSGLFRLRGASSHQYCKELCTGFDYYGTQVTVGTLRSLLRRAFVAAWISPHQRKAKLPIPSPAPTKHVSG